jgi:hypothetical protein
VTAENFDRRWIFVIALVFLFLLRGNPFINIVIVAIGAGWAIQAGLEPWRDVASPIGGPKVTYWRGQRIETPQPTLSRIRSVSLLQICIAVLYLVFGLGMAYATVVLFLRLSNLM